MNGTQNIFEFTYIINSIAYVNYSELTSQEIGIYFCFFCVFITLMSRPGVGNLSNAVCQFMHNVKFITNSRSK